MLKPMTTTRQTGANAATGTPYADALRKYSLRDTVRLNVPGHNADVNAAPELAEYFGSAILRHDVPPLLAGLDKGESNPLAEAQVLAAEAWGAKKTWFLTNGASQANRMAALALGSFKEKSAPVVVQRSAHSSFIDGIILAGLHPEFMQPSIDNTFAMAHGISPAVLRAALANVTGAKGVYVVSPSYFGAVADVAALAGVAHEYGVPLIVDAAWGAHFGFHPNLPGNPLRLGADLMISSTHKLGGSLTQSAMLHLGDSPFAAGLDPLIERAFMLTQSTSASSLLLASLDIARQSLQTGLERISSSIQESELIQELIRAGGRFALASDHFVGFEDIIGQDPLRVAIDVRSGGLQGHAAREDLMTSSGIYTEISTSSCLVAVLGPGRTSNAYRLVDALHRLEPDQTLGSDGGEEPVLNLPAPGKLAMIPREAYLAQSKTVAATDAVGRISTDTLSAYPPGIPNVLPGEIITTETIEFLQSIARTPGGYVRGAADAAIDSLRVVA